MLLNNDYPEIFIDTVNLKTETSNISKIYDNLINSTTANSNVKPKNFLSYN